MYRGIEMLPDNVLLLQILHKKHINQPRVENTCVKSLGLGLDPINHFPNASKKIEREVHEQG
jgi:hypothetical protein